MIRSGVMFVVFSVLLCGLGLAQKPESVVLVLNGQGRGSGTYLGDGLILTAAHVVEDCLKCEVSKDGKSYPASVAVAQTDTDAAVLLVDPAIGLPAVKLSDVEPTNEVLTGCGFDFGDTSALRSFPGKRTTGFGDGYHVIGVMLIRADYKAAVPGNSGGPIFIGDDVCGVVSACDGSAPLRFEDSKHTICVQLRDCVTAVRHARKVRELR